MHVFLAVFKEKPIKFLYVTIGFKTALYN